MRRYLLSTVALGAFLGAIQADAQGLPNNVIPPGANANPALACGLNILLFGAVAGADATAAITAAASAASQGQGCGNVVIPPQSFFAAQTQNLDLTNFPNITISCDDGVAGLQPISNLNAPCTLKTNPAFTVTLGHNTYAHGFRIVNQNFENTTDPRTAINIGNAMSGVGLTASANDITLRHIQINGYGQGLFSNNAQRLIAEDVYGDDTNGSSINNCNDSCHFDHLNWWPFLVTNTIEPQYTVSNVANLGGLFEYTISQTAGNATPLKTGDAVMVTGLGGTNQALGFYTATVVDATHITIPVNFAAGWTSGGNIYLPVAYRAGTAYFFAGPGVGGEKASSLWEYGHAICGTIGPQHGPTNVDYTWCDGETAPGAIPINGTIGWNSTGFGGGIDGGTVINKQFSITENSTDVINRPFTVSNVQIGASGCLTTNNAFAGAAVTDTQGAVEITNSFILGMPACGNISANYAAFYIPNTPGGAARPNTILVSNTDFDTATAAFQTPSAGCPNFVVDGVAGPCALTPTLAGQTTAGTPTYTTQTASYFYHVGSGVIDVDVNLSASLSGASGNLIIGGIVPVINTVTFSPHIQAGCYPIRIGNVNFSANGTQIAPTVDTGDTKASLFIIGTGAGAVANTSMLSGTGQFQFHCTWH